VLFTEHKPGTKPDAASGRSAACSGEMGDAVPAMTQSAVFALTGSVSANDARRMRGGGCAVNLNRNSQTFTQPHPEARLF
jgi:hypothetical protein